MWELRDETNREYQCQCGGGRRVPEGLNWEGGCHWHGTVHRTSVVDMAVAVSRSQAIHGSDRGQSLYMSGVLVAAHLRNAVSRTPQDSVVFLLHKLLVILTLPQ